MPACPEILLHFATPPRIVHGMEYRKALSAEEIADIDAALLAQGLVRTAAPEWRGMSGRNTRPDCESLAINVASMVDESRPHLRWVAWGVTETASGHFVVSHFVIRVAPVACIVAAEYGDCGLSANYVLSTPDGSHTLTVCEIHRNRAMLEFADYEGNLTLRRIP